MKDNQEEIVQKLGDHGLRNTEFRRQVLSAFLQHEGEAIALHGIEVGLGEFDRITLYRTIKSFVEKGLIHQTIDHDGVTKYAICDHHCDEQAHHDEHVHFECDSCKRTLCMPINVGVESFALPQGYHVDNVKVSMTGICDECSR